MPKRRGPAPKNLDDTERAEFLNLIRRGFGVHMALQQMRVGWARYERTCAKDPEFQGEVRRAMAFRDEQLVTLRYAQALGGDGRALDFLIGRGDRIRQFMAERRDRLRLAREAAGTEAEDDFEVDLSPPKPPPQAGDPPQRGDGPPA